MLCIFHDSLVTNCCYKMAENPEINHVVNKETKDALCHILGIMVKKYNHGLGKEIVDLYGE